MAQNIDDQETHWKQMQTPSDNPLNEPYNLVYLDSDEQIAK